MVIITGIMPFIWLEKDEDRGSIKADEFNVYQTGLGWN